MHLIRVPDNQCVLYSELYFKRSWNILTLVIGFSNIFERKMTLFWTILDKEKNKF